MLLLLLVVVATATSVAAADDDGDDDDSSGFKSVVVWFRYWAPLWCWCWWWTAPVTLAALETTEEIDAAAGAVAGPVPLPMTICGRMSALWS